MSDSNVSIPNPWYFRMVPWGMTFAALALFGVTMSRGAFPGLPAKTLVWHLGLDSSTTLLDSLWGGLIRLITSMTGAAPALGAGWVSVGCGAACVGLVTALMMRVRYAVHDAKDPDEMGRETQARLLAGISAGLFTMASLPFWILATRSLPGAFHLLMLLGAAWLFSEFQRTGKVWLLYLLGLLYGVGVTEFATFWVFAPLVGVLVVRAMLQRAEFRPRVLVTTGLCALPGLLLYFVNGWGLAQNPTVQARGIQSLAATIWYIWRDQWHLVVNAPQISGFLLVMVLTVVPWCVIYLLRGRRPAWRFTFWQTSLRLVALAAALAALFNSPLSPWRFFGMHYLMVTPYLILAACAGAVTGEFWVMGQKREHRNAGLGQPLRMVMAGVGLLIPVAAIAAGVLNFSKADGRPGAMLDVAAAEIVENLDGRDVVLSSIVLEDHIRLQAFQRKQPLIVISLARASSADYTKFLANHFELPRQKSLLQVGFGAFLQDFLATDAGLARTASIDLADPLREAGYLVPDCLIYRAYPSEEHLDLAALLATQKVFWQRMEESIANRPHPQNPGAIYQAQIHRMASKVANDIGFLLIERGEKENARIAFQQARVIFPQNISALLNLLTLSAGEESKETEEYKEAWEEFRSTNPDQRAFWSLASSFGYVHNTGHLVRQGIMWAVSGKPRMAEAALRQAAGGNLVNPQSKAFLGRAFLHGGDIPRSTEYYREAIEANPKDAHSMRMLGHIKLSSENYDEAERLYEASVAAGMPAESLAFERIALSYLRGNPDSALRALKELVKTNKEHVQAWSFLAMLTAGGSDPEAFAQAIKALKGLAAKTPTIRLLLAELHINRREWVAARGEIEQIVRMNPRMVRAWEMMVNIDFQERKQDLAENHVRFLLTLDPENYTGNLMLASLQFSRGQHALAESSYRAALAARRDPVVLNDLANLLMYSKAGAQGEARSLIEEALALHPNNLVFLSTRGELNLRENRLDEAELDLQRILHELPDNATILLLSAQLYFARGQTDAARSMATPLTERQNELQPELQTQLQALLKELR